MCEKSLELFQQISFDVLCHVNVKQKVEQTKQRKEKLASSDEKTLIEFNVLLAYHCHNHIFMIHLSFI